MLSPELAQGSLTTLVGATSNLAAVTQNPLYRNLGACLKGGILPANLVAQGIGLDSSQVDGLEMQLNLDKAVTEAKKVQDQALQSLTGIEDNAKYLEYERKKRELLINMQNQTAKLQDTITQVTMIYSIVGSAIG